MEFSYENIEIGYLVECLTLGLVCNADTRKIEVKHYDNEG